MRLSQATNRHRATLFLAIFFMLCCLTPATKIQAQGTGDPTSSPTPEATPSATPSATAEAFGLRDQMVVLIEAARNLIPTIRRLVEKPMMPLIMRLSWILASFILVFAFLRILRDNNGASTEFYYWTGRAIFFLFLIGVSAYLVFYLTKAGNSLTVPLESTTITLQNSFDEKYKQFTEGHFTLKDSDQVWVPPRVTGEPGLMGILYDKDKKLKDPQEALDISSWEMPKLFAMLSFARAFMEFADLFLLVGGGFIIIFLHMAAPLMSAIGIDQKLAHQTTYPYIWGTLSFTLCYPLVREIIRIFGYVVGNLALSVYDGHAMYWMDERTGEIITQAGYEPTFTIFLAAFIMFVTALSMCLAPFLAYKFLKGQVFEGISGVTAGWMASIIGSGVELYGLRASAAITQQAQGIGYEGQYRSEVRRAEGQKEAADISARSRQIVGAANIQGGLTAALASIRGNQTTQRMIADAGQNFGNAQTRAGVRLSQSDIEARRDQANRQTMNDQDRTLATNDFNYLGSKGKTFNGSFGPFGYWGQRKWMRYELQKGNEAANTYAGKTIQMENYTASRLADNQGNYENDMSRAYTGQRNETVAGVDTGAKIAAGGAAAGAGQSLGGINKGYQLDLKANKVIYDSTKDAAQINLTAGLERAKLEALSHVVSMFFRDVSRKIEGGLTPRY